MRHTVLGATFDVRVIKPSEAMTYTDKLDALLRAELNEMQARAVIRDDDRERYGKGFDREQMSKEYDPTITP